MTWLFLWVFGAIIVAVAAQGRTFGPGWALLASLMLSPLVGLLFVLTSDKVKPRDYVAETNSPLKQKAYALWLNNDFAAAIDTYNQYLMACPRDGQAWYYKARIHSHTGEIAKAYEGIERAFANGFTNTNAIQADKYLENMRSMPAFMDFCHNGYKRSDSINAAINEHAANFVGFIPTALPPIENYTFWNKSNKRIVVGISIGFFAFVALGLWMEESPETKKMKEDVAANTRKIEKLEGMLKVEKTAMNLVIAAEEDVKKAEKGKGYSEYLYQIYGPQKDIRKRHDEEFLLRNTTISELDRLLDSLKRVNYNLRQMIDRN